MFEALLIAKFSLYLSHLVWLFWKTKMSLEKQTAFRRGTFPLATKQDTKNAAWLFPAEMLGGAVLVRQASLPGAERKREQDEEETSQNENGSRWAHAGHRPGQFVV